MSAGSCAHKVAMVAALALGLAPGQAAPQSIGPLAQAYNSSGLELFQTLAATEPGNVVLSPLSIGTAMAMVLSGARSETEAEMRKVLRHTLAGGAIDEANAKALAVLLAADPPNAAARLRIANALMLVNPAATVADDFRNTIRTHFGAEIFAGADLNTVNSWVKDRTEGKSPSILDRLTPHDSHVLLNAVYFNAPWAQTFARSATRDREFHLTATERVEVPAMSQQAAFAIEKGDGFSAIRLPYAREGLSMIVLRPDAQGGLDKLIAGLDGTKLGALIQALRKAPKRSVVLTLPKFKFEFSADLVAPFRTLGMSKVFDPAQSDLSGLTGLPRDKAQSTIDQIAHRAVIEVAEEGTEATAATAIVVTTRTMTPGQTPERFDVDRPFLFAISDDKTGAILFLGRASDPRK